MSPGLSINGRVYPKVRGVPEGTVMYPEVRKVPEGTEMHPKVRNVPEGTENIAAFFLHRQQLIVRLVIQSCMYLKVVIILTSKKYLKIKFD